MSTEEQIKVAEALIKSDPALAAYMLASAQAEVANLRATLHAIQTFAGNPALAREGLKPQIEFAIGGRVL
jgi:hypothetical protein